MSDKKIYRANIVWTLGSPAYFRAESAEEARQLASKLADANTIVLAQDLPDDLTGYEIDSIDEIEHADEEDKTNADENAEALIELNGDFSDINQ